jgi:TonB family protein
MRVPSLIAALCACGAIAYGQTAATGPTEQYREELQVHPANSLAHFRLAEIFLQEKNFQSAANEFRAALTGDRLPEWVEVWSHVRLGEIFDQTGQQDRAVNEYRLAGQTGDNTGGAQAVAAAHKPKAPSHPEPIQRTEPEYSKEARAAGLEGTVFVNVVIAEDGTPLDTQTTLALGLGLEGKAIEAVKKWRFEPDTSPGHPTASFATVAVDFLLPSKLSRWHLVGASFQPPEGASRPEFLTELYPLGPGISAKAIDEGWVLAAIRRPATVTLSFEINARGIPTKFQVLAASDPIWGNEAIAVVRNWRFRPAVKDGTPVSVPCTLDLVWGQKTWTPASLAKVREAFNGSVPSQIAQTRSITPEIISAYLNDSSAPRNPGAVFLTVMIGEDGIPKDIHILHGLGTEPDAKAIEAVRQWRFKPSLVNGAPASAPTTVEVDFRLK